MSPATPNKLGYQMPPEWVTHAATWLAWPKNRNTWPEDLAEVEQSFLKMIEVITEGESVHLLVDNPEEERRVSRSLESRNIDLGRIQFFQTPTVDIWIRDYGPNFILQSQDDQGGLAYNRWQFNAWGNKYKDQTRDHEVLETLAPSFKAQRFEPGIVLEGGSIEVNGEGVCLTTEQCLLNSNRNSQLNKEAIEGYLKDYLGVEKVIRLKEGIAGDDTDGHVDDIARFVSPNTIAVAYEENTQDENHKPLLENFKQLEQASDSQGQPFRVFKLPMPPALHYKEDRLPASYANFYICNAAVLVPTFGHPQDRMALSMLDEVFPTRKVVGIDCRVMVRGLGAIHCATQQQPSTTKHL